MRITEILPYKGSTVCIILENGRRIYIHRKIAETHALKVGEALGSDEADSLERENLLRKAQERALYLLEGRDYSRFELYRKLKDTYDEDIAEEICDKMEKLRLLDDRRYAEKLCGHMLEVRHYGLFRIKQELRRRGIDAELVQEILDDISDDDEESFERLEKLIEQKYERYLTDRKGVEKVKNALLRLGYSYGQIKEALDLYDLDFEDD